MGARKIIHVDADCFYAAVEMRDHPEWRDIPLAVGGNAQRRGVLTTCNYPARAFGIHSAMPTSQALKRCPDLVVIPPNFSLYKEVSRAMHDIFQHYTSLIEPLSLDEAYLDVSDNDAYEGSATRVATAIREAIEQELNITVSAGVSVNKFVAKVASDWQKPNGLTVVPPHEVDEFVAALPVKKIPGVGSVTAAKLERMGLRHCADIRQWPPQDLAKKLGSFGYTLHERAHGRDDRAVNPDRIRKSISVEQTYADDLPNGTACLEKLSELLPDLMSRIERAKAETAIQKAFVKIKFNDFSTTTVEKVGTTARISDYRDLMTDGLSRKSLPVRLLGVGVRLVPGANQEAEQLRLGVADGALDPDWR